MYGGRRRPFSAAEKSNRKISIISSNGLETAEMTGRPVSCRAKDNGFYLMQEKPCLNFSVKKYGRIEILIKKYPGAAKVICHLT